MFEGVPTMYMIMLAHPELARFDLSSLTRCTVGGQTMPVAKMQEVEQHFGCPLIELWGMTELAGLGTTFPCHGPHKLGSIGIALPHVEARIADVADASQDHAARRGGRADDRGPIVMQGYYGNEKATREAIEPDGWLHTGDLARMDAAGAIFIVDRKKDMINTAGFKVFPAEIERVVAPHPGVAMVAVGRSARRAQGRDRQGLRRAEAGRHAGRGCDSCAVPGSAGGVQGAAGSAVRCRSAQDVHRQDHAPRTQDARRRRGLKSMRAVVRSARSICHRTEKMPWTYP